MMSRIWVSLLNRFSQVEFRVAEQFGETISIGFHFCLFWILPAVLLYVARPYSTVAGVVFALFYIFVLIGDILFSVFGHEELENRRGMLDIESVQEMREEIFGAVVKYLGGIVSFSTVFNGLQILTGGTAFQVQNPSSLPYFDLLYFSIVTITTVGYGDITPAATASRLLVISEIAFGLGFIVLLFTMLISVYIDIQKQKKSDSTER